MLQIEINEHAQILVNGDVKGEIDFKIQDDPAIRQIIQRVNMHEKLMKLKKMIEARIQGVFDDTDLMEFGLLSTDPDEDILKMIEDFDRENNIH